MLDQSDLIPDHMSKLIPEVKDDKMQEEAQPGTGASFRYPISIMIFAYAKTLLELLSIFMWNLSMSKVGVSDPSSELITAECHDDILGNPWT